MTVEEHNVEIDGLPIRFRTAGEGPPLVLLHGAGDNALDWQWVMPFLAATHQVYAPDLPGSPDSARPTANYSPAFFERFIATFVDALDIGRATFVGNSLGGLVALRLALSEPARVTALVLVDSAGLGYAVNPAFTSVNVPGLGEVAIPFWRTDRRRRGYYEIEVTRDDGSRVDVHLDRGLDVLGKLADHENPDDKDVSTDD